jgi:hypothetical protein
MSYSKTNVVSSSKSTFNLQSYSLLKTKNPTLGRVFVILASAKIICSLCTLLLQSQNAFR